MSAFPDNVLLIGVDGGASEVKAHQVLVLSEEGRLPSLTVGPASASACYERLAGFTPVPIAEQLAAHAQRRVRTTEIEDLQGELMVEATAGSILSVAAQAGERNVVVGLCLPGLKTPDQHGISVLRHGPRILDFVGQLTRELVSEGLVLAHPIGAIASDGEACVRGERYDIEGALRSVENAYYIGGGTGLAEAFVLDGVTVGLDALDGVVPKAWQMESELGANFEDLLSTRGLNARFAERTGRLNPASPGEYPEDLARHGDEVARTILTETAAAFAELVASRTGALLAGVPSFARARGSNAKKREGEVHGAARSRGQRTGTLLERVVVGQRLATLFADPEIAPWLRDLAEERLAQAFSSLADLVTRAQLLDGSMLRSGFLTVSHLRAAPAVGAAALAWRATTAAPNDRVRRAQE